MGRPINGQRYFGAVAPHQIQAAVWGAKDTGVTAGYLSGQNSPRRFKSTTANGTSLTTLANGVANVVAGTCSVNVFAVGTEPTTCATGVATLMAIGNANVTSGGANYKPGDYIILVGGTFSAAANVKVLTVGAGNAVATLSTPVNQGPGVQKYTVLPANIAAIPTANATGNGSGAVVSFNFGVDTATVTSGGAGYTTANFAVVGATVAPTFTQPTVTNGVVATGAVTVTSVGVVDVNPVVTITAGVEDTEALSYMSSMNYLETFQGNRYRWFYKNATIPSDYASLGVKVAYLDTL
jgi:hypothetical protein